MKQTIKIPKSRLAAPIDFGAVISSCKALDIKLKYGELSFIQTSCEPIVMFDAYSASHSYVPVSDKSGVLAFPFYLCCMTDGGERVAYCGLRYSEEKAVEWRLCRDDAALIRLVYDENGASVPISSGVCCLATASAYKEYRAHIKDEIHPLSGHIVLNGQTHECVDLFGKKYAVFSTGWGDGSYRCYEGVAQDGSVVALIVDFGMIEYARHDKSEIEEVQVDLPDSTGFVYDPSKSESENNVAKWTLALIGETDSAARLLAYARRGYAYHSMNNIDAALADYTSAVAECKHVTDRGLLLRAWSVYDNAAEIYIKRSDYDSAIALMIDALSVKDHFYAGAYVRLIDLYLLTKRTDKAMEIAARLIAERPDDPVANMKYAEVCVASMNYTGAARTYERLATEFQFYENLFDEASCLIELGDLDGADSALERHPTKEYNEQYWYYKAYIDYKKRRYSDALKKAEKSYGMDNEYMPALYLLIDIHSIMQEYHAVARYAEEYIKLRPDNEYGYCVCAEAHMILGNFSECSRNYGYIYDAIVKDDKYAALSAITAAKMGDSKRKARFLKILRRKHSDYYSGAIYAVYITKYNKRALELSKVVYKLRTDDDFLLQLAVYLTGNDEILPATHILDMLVKKNSSSFEVVAQQVRTAVKLGDEKLFEQLFDYYIEHYAGNVTDSDKALIAERFRRVGKMRHVDWDFMHGEISEMSGLYQREQPVALIGEKERGDDSGGEER